MREIDVKNQKEFDRVVSEGNIPIVRTGYFEAYGSAQVRAYDSAQVRAYGSAQVRAYGSAQVTAYGSAQVTAYDSAQVRAYDSAQVTASAFVAVTIHGIRTKVVGGVVIKLPSITSAEQWCDFYGVEPPGDDGLVTLYKATDREFTTSGGPNPFKYEPGTMPSAPDWDDGKAECGGGLHFSPSPAHALRFSDHGFDTRFVACPIKLDEVVVHEKAVYPDKIKAPRVAAPCYEVDIFGKQIGGEAK